MIRDYAITPLSSDSFCTMAQALKHLKLDDRDVDGAIITPQDTQDEVRLAIDSAIAQVENHCAVVLGSRNFTTRMDAFNAKVQFPFFEVTAITSVMYVDKEGQDIALPASSYKLATYRTTRESILIIKGEFPEIKEDSEVIVSGTCGTVTVPADVKKAVRLLIGDSDTYREDRALPGSDRAVSALLRPYKY